MALITFGVGLIAFIFNLPWTIIGLIGAALSGAYRVRLSRRPLAIIFKVRSLWWYRWLPGKQGTRAITNGHVIQLGPLELERDLEHELIHVEQAEREPFIYPFLYVLESWRHGYRQNRYEDEAYSRAGNVYKLGGKVDHTT